MKLILVVIALFKLIRAGHMTKRDARNGHTIYSKIQMQTIVFLRGASSLVISVQ